MSRKISLLDCTLRDGGYVNDWLFGHDNIVSVFERIVDAGTDIIEVGFLDDRRPFDYDRSIMPDTDSVGKIYGDLDKKNTKVFGMIDYGTCSLDNIKPCSESYLDGIRVIFKKHLKDEALRFCSELKKLGYIVFAQLVSVTAYSDDDLKELCALANATHPDAVSMVDTYGLTHQKDLKHILEILDENLDHDIAIGYHGHNNFQMAYANCQMILAYSDQTDRELLVDGTLYGMGKSAGNAPIELVAMHMNNEYGKEYHLSQYLEAIDANIMEFYQPATWGYSLFFFLAASNDCHPNYVKQLTNKHTLSIKQINELLGKLQGEKKLLYDKDYMERLYVEFQDKEINDSADIEALARELRGKTILVTGPGTTIKTESKKIGDFVMSADPLIISINYASRAFMPDYIFLTNTKRHIQVATLLSKEKIPVIATSNVTPTDKPFEYVMNISALLDRDSEYADNSLMMILKVLMRSGVKEVNLAGFDGYSGTDANYLDEGKEYDFAKQKADYLNNYMSGFIRSHKDDIKVNFLTTTRYDIT
ncbi:MAG: aldolase catalytic domain-containing protein [Saccharofermentans sp.]|nr:aldolase catalytic domain-containing protein [Saccharofermentans sp.]